MMIIDNTLPMYGQKNPAVDTRTEEWNGYWQADGQTEEAHSAEARVEWTVRKNFWNIPRDSIRVK